MIVAGKLGRVTVHGFHYSEELNHFSTALIKALAKGQLLLELTVHEYIL